MCVWYPLWPVQRLLSEPPELETLASEATVKVNNRTPHSRSSPPAPIILFAESPRGLYVTACSFEASRAGIRSGMPLGEARSLFPGTLPGKPSRGPRRNLPKPVFHRADPARDRTRLQQLALHCQRYSPLAGLEETAEPESLWLDISGNESLFGGEAALITAMRADFAQQGFQARIAIADSWGTAWGVCHFASAPVTIVAAQQQAEALASLPISALRVPSSIVESLQTLDVVTIGGLMRLPRTALPSRFGKELLRRLDQALGTIPELLVAERLIEPLFAEWLFEDPVTDRATLEHVMGVLLDQLLGQLNQRRVGLRELNCRWVGTTTEPISLRLLRPTTDRRHLFELLRLQCERRVFTGGVNGIHMELVEMGLPPVKQRQLFEDDADRAERQQQSLAELVDRLGSRLGRHAVLRPVLSPDPQPEYACQHVPWLEGVNSVTTTTISRSQLRCRPLRLLRTPQPLTVQASPRTGLPTHVAAERTGLLPVIRIAGPERIETGWWRGPDTKRDYYRMDLTNGTSLWTFLDRESRTWFLHGLFV